MTKKNSTPADDTGKLLARHAATAFQGAPKVIQYLNEAESQSVDVLICSKTPQPAATSYATVSLWKSVAVSPVGKAPFCVEVVGACTADKPLFANVIAQIGLNALSGGLAVLGAVHEGVVAEYYPDASCKHCVLGVPFSWGDNEPETIEYRGKRHLWLQAIPITDAEAAYLKLHGFDALESLLDQAQVDVLDLNRACALA